MKQPNIIIMLCDQLRYDSLACNGNRVVQTPNIDRLAEGGVNCHETTSSCPICAPFRGSLITGRFAHSNGVICNQYKLHDQQSFLASVLHDAGYRSAWIGKWHLGSGPYDHTNRYGFDDMYAYNCSHHYYDISYYHNEAGPFKVHGYAPRTETSLCLDWIQKHQEAHAEQAFAAVLSWGPPHWTYSVGGERDYGDYPQEYNIYDAADCEVAPNVPPMLRDYAQKEFADYYGMISSLDDQVGRVLDYLDQNNLSDDTIVVFTSDHGDHLSAHGYGKPGCMWMPPALRASKATPFEESVRIPFLLRYPKKLKAFSTNYDQMNTVDMMPTILGLANVSVPDSVQGIDCALALQGQAKGPEHSYLQIIGTGWPSRKDWVGFWRGVRSERYTYARFAHPHTNALLFDRHEDPYQRRNVIDDPRYHEVAAEHEAVLQHFLRSTNDPFDHGDRMPGTQMINIGQQLIESQNLEQLPDAYRAAYLRQQAERAHHD